MMVHTLRLDNYSPTPRKLVLGTNSSYGTESIKIERGAGWDGLNLTATWHIPGREEPLRVALLDGDAMDVPPEVTKEAKDGVLVLAGLASGVQRASCNVEYLILEQAGVYGGTDAEPTPELAAQVLEAALQAKADAEAAAEDSAAAKANADKAQADAEKAQQAAENAAADAAKAGPYAEAALAAQEAAEAASDDAQAAARAASASETAAAANEKAAAASEKAAAASAVAAAGSAAQAEAQKTAAEKSASDAQGYMQTASGAATAANASAKNAAGSKAAAASSATAADESKQAAVKSEVKAAESEQAAKASEQAAAKSAQAALESKTAAATSEVNAAASAKKAQDVSDSLPADYTAMSGDVGTLKNQMQRAYPDDSTIGENTWSSKHIIDMLCPPLEESGNPVVCYPVAGYPLGVKASWEPMQEGTGTPYPAGGGKNLFNPAWMPEKEVNHGVTWTTATDGTVTANGAANATSYYNSDLFSLPAGTYTISAMPYFRMTIRNRDVGDTTIAIQAVGQPCTFTVENDIQKASLFFAASGTLDKVSAKPQIEKGSAATAYAPYENIRPIKGRDSVRVERCGENLLPFGERIENIYRQQLMPSDALLLLSKAYAEQKLTLTFSVETQNIVFNDVVEDEWRKRIGFECNGTLADGTETYSLQCWLDNRDGELTKNGKKTKTVTVTMPKLANGDITFYAQNIKSGSYVAYGFGIYAGTTAITTYTPYTGQTTPLTLPETVYGGEVDAVDGDAKKTWKSIILNGTESWNTWGINAHNPAVTGFYTYDITDYDAINVKGICSHLAPSGLYVWGGRQAGIGFAKTGKLRYFMYCVPTSLLPDISAGHEVASLKAYLAAQRAAGTPVQVCYKLAEPIPFTATGAQPLPALAGVNTMLTDADSATVTGRADPIKRITDLEDAVASQT